MYILIYDNPRRQVFGRSDIVKFLDPGFSGDKSEILEYEDQRAFISEKVEEDKRWSRESMYFRPSFPVIP